MLNKNVYIGYLRPAVTRRRATLIGGGGGGVTRNPAATFARVSGQLMLLLYLNQTNE